MSYRNRACVILVLAAVAVGLCGASAHAAVTVLGTQYQPDRNFPEHNCFWFESQYPGPCSNPVLGANVHVYLKNTGPGDVTVSDVTLAGFSMADILSLHFQVVKRQPASIYLEGLSSGDFQTLVNAGEPVWYKIDPAVIPAGGVGHVAIRLRVVPVTLPVSLTVVTSAGTLPVSIAVDSSAPQLTSASFSPDLTKAYLYWRRTGGAAPTTILFDGIDVTANTTTVTDASMGIASSVVTFGSPLAPTSFHVFQGVYADSKTATAGLRAWVNKFLYGTWGGKEVDDGDDAAAQTALIDFTNHGMNCLVQNGSGTTAVLQKSNAGKAFVAAQDYGFVIDEIGKWDASNPLMWFIRDEPDAADSRLDVIPNSKKIGCLGQMALQTGETLRVSYPLAPTTLNIDGTYKPYNYYNYGQVPDVFMTDPYYQVRMREAYWSNPARIPLYQKATYIYAVSQIAASVSEPNPLHVILYSCQWKDSSGAVFPFPTPESKRIEVYYALAAGAKGLAYWWYPAGAPSNGIGFGGAQALALWKEMGLLGNEIKTAAPLLVTSCPTTMGLSASSGVWTRALSVGTDTLIVFAVNDQYLNDEAGCHYTPVAGATVTATLPAYLQGSPTAFEISAAGTGNVTSQINGAQFQMNLGTLNLTRMLVITTNPQLRSTIQQRYDSLVQAKVCAFAPEVCTQAIPPTISQQPASRSACEGTTTAFTVGATGPGTLTYQWQKNNNDLSNGGHYSGVLTATLTITGVSGADVGSYRCVVSNSHGSVNSDSAALAVQACNPGCLQNLGFEAGFTNGIGNGWTKFLREGNVTLADETVERHSGLHSQEVYSPNKGNDGGVYQQLTATPGQPYTVKAWIKTYSPQGTGIAEGFFGIDPTGGTDPLSPNILWASKPWDYWSQDTWNITAQNTVITVYLRGRSTRTGRTAYIWLDDMEVSPGAPTDLAPQVLGPTSIRWRWNDLGIETGYRVRDGGNDKSGVLPIDTTFWTETVGISPNTQYTRHVHALNDCGESDASGGRTAYSQIEMPTDITLANATTTSIQATPVGSFSNLAAGSSGLRVVNATNSTNSGWVKTVATWTSSGLSPNTPYEFTASGRNGDGLETTSTEPVTGWTLPVPPGAGSITVSPTCAAVSGSLTWTAVGGFGPGKVQSYLYAWDQNPTHSFTGTESRWSSGTLNTTPTASGTWYLHVQGRNGEDVPNGTFDYPFSAGTFAKADFDHDCDVDEDDFEVFHACVSGPTIPRTPPCSKADFDNDYDVDQSDFGVFQQCISGAGNPPNCN